jgi:NADH-quinone oxidoreductase subunit L
VVIAKFPGGEMLDPLVEWIYPIGNLGGIPLNIAISVDSLGALMLAMVTIIGACVQVYSLKYMGDDERRGWFFTVLSLFTAAMLLLVMSGDLLLIFVMWEIMGVCSYLLIGFWYKELAPRRASQKAFLVTRAADGGFFIALAAVFVSTGTFNISEILAAAPMWPAWIATVVALGLLWAAMGKSAQVPLQVWLPDAMAGPTPGSALIHAATMVAAGVFMVARMLPVFQLTPWIMQLMGWIGITTAIFGAAMACFQTDIKKVMAFSTISQLGAMFIALGAGSAYYALFHLTTHAFFKSLLFLVAGIIIHAFHTGEIKKMGGLFKLMPWTATVFTIGVFALAGVFPLSGFFSKDEIFGTLFSKGYYVWFGFALLMGTLTSIYVFKTWFRVCIAPPKNTDVHEGSPVELIPVSVLAAITVVGGFGLLAFCSYIGYESSWPTLLMAGISTGVVLFGGTIGFLAYRGVFDRFKKPLRFIGVAFDNRLYTDALYDYAIIKPFFWIADKLWILDAKVIDGIVNGVVGVYGRVTKIASAFDARVVDGTVNGVSAAYVGIASLSKKFDQSVIDGVPNGLAFLSKAFGSGLRRIQNGKLQTYQRLALGSVIALLVMIVVLKGL